MAGAQIHMDTSLQRIEIEPSGTYTVWADQAGQPRSWPATHIFSTIPLTVLARALQPSAPADVAGASGRLQYRSMILIYLQLQAPQFTEFNAHYFPEASLHITRLSEPKHYGLAESPTTVLCAELPCQRDDSVWQQSDAQLAELVKQDLATAGIPIRVPVVACTTRRLPQAYPIYTRGFRQDFDRLDEWVAGHTDLTSLGRQGLFAHDNTHHTLAMAYAAEQCLAADGSFDWPRWSAFRQEFETHVVED